MCRVQMSGDRKGSRKLYEVRPLGRQANMVHKSEVSTLEVKHRIQVIQGKQELGKPKDVQIHMDTC